MNPAAYHDLVALDSAIKREWTVLLRGEPATTPLGRPDTLVFLMDATLAQLLARFNIESEEKWLRACAPIIAPVHIYCSCGLNPLTKYFATGELALRAVAGPVLPREIEGILELFRTLAHQEIETLCNLCQHKGAPGCCKRPDKFPAGC